jgi:hypothetical protein
MQQKSVDHCGIYRLDEVAHTQRLAGRQFASGSLFR